MEYLAIVCKVSFQDILNVNRINSVDKVAGRGEHPESLVLVRDVSLEVLESMEVLQLLKHGSRNWRVISSSPFLGEQRPKDEFEDKDNWE